MRTSPRVLPVPETLAAEMGAMPTAFELGVQAASDGDDVASNPYSKAAPRRAWAAGFLAQREGWTEVLK